MRRATCIYSNILAYGLRSRALMAVELGLVQDSQSGAVFILQRVPEHTVCDQSAINSRCCKTITSRSIHWHVHVPRNFNRLHSTSWNDSHPCIDTEAEERLTYALQYFN